MLVGRVGGVAATAGSGSEGELVEGGGGSGRPQASQDGGTVGVAKTQDGGLAPPCERAG